MTPQEKADAWNHAHKVGTPVLAFPGALDGRSIETRTMGEATVLSGHTAVVWCHHITGCIALSHIKVIENTRLQKERT